MSGESPSDWDTRWNHRQAAKSLAQVTQLCLFVRARFVSYMNTQLPIAMPTLSERSLSPSASIRFGSRLRSTIDQSPKVKNAFLSSVDASRRKTLFKSDKHPVLHIQRERGRERCISHQK
jgi:hypothetical protein